MFKQLLPNASQRRHWRANDVGPPVQAPLVTDSVPVTFGSPTTTLAVPLAFSVPQMVPNPWSV